MAIRNNRFGGALLKGEDAQVSRPEEVWPARASRRRGGERQRSTHSRRLRKFLSQPQRDLAIPLRPLGLIPAGGILCL
jgi:hypothetical protein